MLGHMQLRTLRRRLLGVAQAAGTALQDADFVVQPLDEAEGDLVLVPNSIIGKPKMFYSAPIAPAGSGALAFRTWMTGVS